MSYKNDLLATVSIQYATDLLLQLGCRAGFWTHPTANGHDLYSDDTKLSIIRIVLLRIQLD